MIESTKDKIDKALGLTSGQSIDDLLGDIATDVQKAEDAFEAVTSEMQNCLAEVDD